VPYAEQAQATLGFREGFAPADPQERIKARRVVSINRHVNYVLPDGNVRAAIVTAVTNPTLVDLAVFLPGESHVFAVRNVVEGTGPDTWHWPTVI
jgi:hypothetical protein